MKSGARKRILFSRILGVPLVFIMIFSAPSWDRNSYLSLIVESTGYFFLIIATLGRLWCSTYVGGYKSDVLVKEGPYSVVRNPLFGFSFLGGIGFGLAAENLLATFLILLAFISYYPAVVKREETKLETRFREEFRAYKKKTPRWLPRFSVYHEPQEYIVKPKYVRKTLFDAMWFMWALILWQIVEKLQALTIVPVIWRFP